MKRVWRVLGGMVGLLAVVSELQAAERQAPVNEFEQQVAAFVLESVAAGACHWTSDPPADLTAKRRGVVAHLLRLALERDLLTAAEAERIFTDYTEPAGVALADRIADEAIRHDGLCQNHRARRDWGRWVDYSAGFAPDGSRPQDEDRATRFRTEAEAERRSTVTDFLQATTLAEIALQCHWHGAEPGSAHERLFHRIETAALDAGRSPVMVAEVHRQFSAEDHRAVVRAAVAEDLTETGLCTSPRTRTLWEQARTEAQPRR